MSIMVFKKQAPVPVTGDGTSQATEFTWAQVSTGATQARLSPLTEDSGNETLYAWCGLYLTQGTTYIIDVPTDASSSLYSEAGVKLADGEWYEDPETYNSYNRISFQCSTSGLYGFRAETSSWMGATYIDVTMSTTPGQDSRSGAARTSLGFDSFGVPVRYTSMLSAGVGKLTPDTIPGAILYAPMSVNGVQTVVGPTLAGNTTSATTVSGVTGVLFDHTSSQSSAFNDLLGLSSFTLACWVYVVSVGNSPTVIAVGGSSNWTKLLMRLSWSEGSGLKEFLEPGNTGGILPDLTSFPTGSWHFCCIVIDGKAVTFRQDSQTATGTLSNFVVLGGAGISIGSAIGGSSEWSMYLSKVRIFNRALSTKELDLLAAELT